MEKTNCYPQRASRLTFSRSCLALILLASASLVGCGNHVTPDWYKLDTSALRGAVCEITLPAGSRVELSASCPTGPDLQHLLLIVTNCTDGRVFSVSPSSSDVHDGVLNLAFPLDSRTFGEQRRTQAEKISFKMPDQIGSRVTSVALWVWTDRRQLRENREQQLPRLDYHRGAEE